MTAWKSELKDWEPRQIKYMFCSILIIWNSVQRDICGYTYISLFTCPVIVSEVFFSFYFALLSVSVYI